MERVHASAVSLGGLGVLIEGPSGSGKSDLALRLIDGGAVLIADDQVRIERRDGRLLASAPETIAGRIEARGIGILTLPHRSRVPLALAVALAPSRDIERLPDPQSRALLGVHLPLIRIDPFTASAPAKVRLALQALPGSIMTAP
jgi:HPr kinase/phosphorylase